jgi:hypothetical protein
MGAAFVGSSNSSTSGSISYSPTAGNLLVFGALIFYNTGGTVTCSISGGGNSFNQTVAEGFTFNENWLFQWYAYNVAGGSTTFSISPSLGLVKQFSLLEFSGAQLSGALDGNASNSFTTTKSGDVVYQSCLTYGTSGATGTPVAASGWQIRDSSPNLYTDTNGGQVGYVDQYIIQASDGAISGGLTFSGGTGSTPATNMIAVPPKAATGGLVDPGGMTGMIFKPDSGLYVPAHLLRKPRLQQVWV